MSIKVTYVPLVVAAAAMTAAFIGQGTASAETKTITKYLTRGGSAYLGAYTQINDCEYAYVNVYGNESTNKQGKWQTTNNANAYIEIGDSCLGTYRYGNASLDGAFVPPDRKLESAATEEMTGLVCDYATGFCSPFDVKVTWTGVGNISRSQSHYHNKSGSYSFVSHEKGISRQAKMVVDLNINDVAVPIEPSSSYGQLSLATSGYVEITRY